MRVVVVLLCFTVPSADEQIDPLVINLFFWSSGARRVFFLASSSSAHFGPFHILSGQTQHVWPFFYASSDGKSPGAVFTKKLKRIICIFLQSALRYCYSGGQQWIFWSFIFRFKKFVWDGIEQGRAPGVQYGVHGAWKRSREMRCRDLSAGGGEAEEALIALCCSFWPKIRRRNCMLFFKQKNGRQMASRESDCSGSKKKSNPCEGMPSVNDFDFFKIRMKIEKNELHWVGRSKEALCLRKKLF